MAKVVIRVNIGFITGEGQGGGGWGNLQRNGPFATAVDEFRNYVTGARRGGKHGGDGGSLGRPAMRLETAMDSVNNLFKRD